MKASCFGTGFAIEVREVPQGVAIGDALTQFSVVPVLHPHENAKVKLPHQRVRTFAIATSIARTATKKSPGVQPGEIDAC